ncbi:hypothetical protein KCP73_05885 [Salmonella enterica subsp. enterica]|nr:hypothetical protein KCP73_05885 [Salmonella enterica subsp. enterica]
MAVTSADEAKIWQQRQTEFADLAKTQTTGLPPAAAGDATANDTADSTTTCRWDATAGRATMSASLQSQLQPCEHIHETGSAPPEAIAHFEWR